MQITGGKVTFGRSVQPAQYETKKAEVEIAFTLSEGEDLGTTLDTAGALAQGKALELVGLKVAPKPAVEPVKETATAPGKTKADLEKEALAKATAAGAKEPTKPKTPPKAKKTEEPAVEPPKEPEQRAITETPEERSDPSLEVPGEDDVLSVPASAITDAELTSAVTQHNAKIKNPTAIRQLILKYVGKTPCQVVDIKPEVRGKFIEELKKL